MPVLGLYGLFTRTVSATGDVVELLIAGPAALFRRTRMHARALGSPRVLVREPEPIPVEGGLMFPDFGLRHRVQRRQVLVEVVGFWTRAYLERKLEALRAIGRHDLLVCIDAKRGVEAEDALDDLPVLAYGRRVDFAGRRPPHTATHAALKALQPGDVVRLEREGAFVHVRTLDGVDLTALSGRGREKWRERLPEIRGAVVVQIVRRVRADSAPGYRHLLRVDSWQVPVIELRLVAREA